MLCVTLIPTHRNDGSPVSSEEMTELETLFWTRFGGCTIRENVRGVWMDPEDSQTYHDSTTEVAVTCEPERLPEVESLVREIGRRLGQKAMYLEVRYADGIRILRTDD